MSDPDSIFALSSGHGRAGVSVIRISGHDLLPKLEDLGVTLTLTPRKAHLIELINPVTKGALDRALVLSFPGPRSFTGEDVVEFHVHGSLAVLDELLEILSLKQGFRPAEPGEFTRRAFENGKMDLTEVEGLADLIDAETKAQKDQALAQAGGSFSRLILGWRESLVRASALMEADIDFADEDLPDHLWAEARELVETVSDTLRDQLSDNYRGERIRNGFRVAILGEPNVGKSSLINALARRDVAIVSDEPGTTRDVVEVHLDLRGIPVVVMDTAGYRENTGKVEAEGIRRALKSGEDADLRIWVGDAREMGVSTARPISLRKDDLILWNKADLLDTEVSDGLSDNEILMSVFDPGSLSDLIQSLEARVVTSLSSGSARSFESAGITRARHRRELEAALEALTDFLSRADRSEGLDTELMAEDLRRAVRALGRLTGRVDVEEILGQIFSAFCIGK